MYHFATLFNRNYLTRGLALYESMVKNIDNFVLYILALDEEVFNYFERSKLDKIKIIELSTLEARYPELLIAKNNRSNIEYIFTLSPVLPLYILSIYKNIEFITTLDADIYFFSSPKPIFDRFKNYSIQITHHNFTQSLKHSSIYGMYNVSFQSFRNDTEGLKCLEHWKSQCIEWCYDKLENDKFADQKYLDTWVFEYEKVLELRNNGVGIAPWNIEKYKINKRNNGVYCDDSKLIFYHFHGLRFITPNIVKHGLSTYRVKVKKEIKDLIYKEYINSLFKLSKTVSFEDLEISRFSTHRVSGLKEFLKGRAFFILGKFLL